MAFKKNNFYLLLWIIFVFTSCKKDAPVESINKPFESYSVQIAIDWMTLMRTMVKQQNINPPAASRLYAYAGITIYESVVDGIKGNKSLQGQLNRFSTNTIPKLTEEVDFNLVINESMFLLAKAIIPINTIYNISLIDELHTRIINRSYKQAQVYTHSIERGKIIGAAIIDYASKDNYTTTRGMVYAIPSRTDNIQCWAPTDPLHLKPVEPFWNLIRPFTLNNAKQFDIPSTIPFSTEINSPFYSQALEVFNTVNNRTEEQSDIRFFWSDPTGSQTPSGHWIGLIKYIAQHENLTLNKVAELYAITGIAGADAFISCWDSKYKYNLLRPETYIHDFVAGQSKWSTGQLDITPPFPEFPSGHSVCSGACAQVLTLYLGDQISVIDSVNLQDYGYKPRAFKSINAIAQEAGISRLYGGIHFREAIEKGLLQGSNIANHIKSKIKFQ